MRRSPSPAGPFTASLLSSLAALLVAVAALFPSAALGEPRQAEGLELLQPTLEAHGGLESWRHYRSLTYRLVGFPLTEAVAKPSRSTVDLRRRFNRIESEVYTVGWNGRQAWAVPGPEAVGLPPRFYALGSFYFVGMPFVFADPGARLTEGGTVTFRGEPYRVLRVRYGDGVGHTDEDDYRIYIHPETHRLAAIDHSVTETGVERVTWTFGAWQWVGRGDDRVLMPGQMTFFPGALTDPAAQTGDGATCTIEHPELSVEPVDPGLYEPPADAVVTTGP